MSDIRTRVDDTGRGDTATADMKARLNALRYDGVDWLEVLWERNRTATLGEGFRYEFTVEGSEPL